MTSPSAKILGEGEFLSWRVFSTKRAPVEEIEGGENAVRREVLGTWPMQQIWKSKVSQDGTSNLYENDCWTVCFLPKDRI